MLQLDEVQIVSTFLIMLLETNFENFALDEKCLSCKYFCLR